MKLFDYHVHNHISFDSELAMQTLCEKAVAAGISEFALTNHYDLDLVMNGFAEAPDLEAEEQELLAAREAYAGRLTILRGIELGQADHDCARAAEILASREYDIVLGSLHNLEDGIDFYFLKPDEHSDESLQSIWNRYLARLEHIAKTADIDVMTHVLYPLRYIPASRKSCLSYGRERFEPIFKALIRRGIALEINTSVVRKGAFPDPEPGRELLAFYRALGGELLSFGSDTHRENELGANITDARRMAEEAGFRYLTTFRNRNKLLEALS